MRACIKLACVVLAWTILPAGVITAGPGRSVHPVQASTRTTYISSANARPAAAAAAAQLTAELTSAVAAPAPVRTYTVQRGDTLSAIAARFGVRGGWPALYAANRPAVGPDPGRIRAGLRLSIPSLAPPNASGPVPGKPAPRKPAPRQPTPAPAPGRPHPHTATPAPSAAPTAPSPAHRTRNRTRPHASTAMPSWLKTMLLAVGLLAVVIFAAEPLLIARRRRRRVIVPASSPHETGPAGQDPPADPAHQTSTRPAGPEPSGTVPEVFVMPAPAEHDRIGPTRIVVADHDRLVITRSKCDDTICVLRPPGEDPADILRVARLVLPEGHYGALAEQLGLPASWPLNQ